jgi:hypothetical protein
MILTAYLDESGTHTESPLSLMAGFIADARQWRKFEKRTGKLFQRYGINVFHAIDLRRGHKDFRGWSVDRKIKFMDEFQHIGNETLEVGFCSILRQGDYVDFYANKNRPKRVVQDTKYGILFRASLSSAIDAVLRVSRWGAGNPPKLYVVLESGHPNSGDAVRLFEFFRSRLNDYQQGALSGIAFKSKSECLPLAIADLFAYNAYNKEMGGKAIGVAKEPLKSEASFKSNLYRILIEKDTLEALYEQSLSLRAKPSRYAARS